VLQTAKAVVMVTHDMSWITAFCTRAILMDKGQIVAEGDPEDIADMHEHDAEKRQKQKRKAKQLLKHGKLDLVDVRRARKEGTLDEVLDGSEETATDLEAEKAERRDRRRRARATRATGVAQAGGSPGEPESKKPATTA
jgi:ABC-type glutathione transport system ATPase component